MAKVIECRSDLDCEAAIENTGDNLVLVEFFLILFHRAKKLLMNYQRLG